MFLPYNGKEAENIVQRCKRRLQKLFKKEKNVKFDVSFQTTKISFYNNNKDTLPKLSNSNVIYEYTCPGCSKKYIGKTESTLFNRTKEHGWKQKDSSVHKHLQTCSHWNHIRDMFQIFGEDVDAMQFQVNAVRTNTKIIGRSRNWLQLAFLEALAIKEFKPELNKGLKSCKDLSLF